MDLPQLPGPRGARAAPPARFFAQPDIPERVISADPDSWYHGDPQSMGQENYEEWRTATRNPHVVRSLADLFAGRPADN
ncbi:hypothetical protein [Streptomyces sp. IBSNAI001]|uniref:hypothetical protein n=1 Tax=Streptomyces sp. IBSNAI001 TaxID=3457499 RepID=UPI003FCFC757